MCGGWKPDPGEIDFECACASGRRDGDGGERSAASQFTRKRFCPAGQNRCRRNADHDRASFGWDNQYLRAAYGGGIQQSSIGLFPLLLGTQIAAENVVGGNSFNGTITLLERAPAGGLIVRLVSSDTALLRPPATITIPEGSTGATFPIATSPVAESIIVSLASGTDSDGFSAARLFVILTPPGGATLPPSLASLTLSQSSVLGGTTTTGTVTLTGPAPAGGAVIPLSGSLEGEVVTPPSVTVPAGSTSANFTITAPHVLEPHWVVIQGNYGTFNGNQAATLEINPGSPGPPTVFAVGVADSTVTAGDTVRGTAGIFAPAPAGGAAVKLKSDNPSVVQVPARGSHRARGIAPIVSPSRRARCRSKLRCASMPFSAV